MKNIISAGIFLIFVSAISANDGSYYVSGNQLIPVYETTISCKKEILTLKKIRNEYVEVVVYYEFYNPGPEKEVLVGFEAEIADGDVAKVIKNKQSPFISEFTVNLNDEILPYQTAVVNSELYQSQKSLVDIPISEDFNVAYSMFVYHFKAKFKTGINILKHTYNYKLSTGVNYFYKYDYVLTAAKRWSNKQIDNFTLIIDNGDFETFCINKTFFSDASDWVFNGIGKSKNVVNFNEISEMERPAVQFQIQKGEVFFQKENFKPAGELSIYSVMPTYGDKQHIPFSFYQTGQIFEPESPDEVKLLRNLPFARRGYVFKDTRLNEFYTRQNWYIANPSYIPNTEYLYPEEVEWMKELQ